jgi:hypothetical protein
MSLYFFRVDHGRYAGASDQPYECENHDAAWREMTAVCANLVSSISRCLKQNADWQMELLDEAKKPIFRIRLVGGVGRLVETESGRRRCQAFRKIGAICVICREFSALLRSRTEGN